EEIESRLLPSAAPAVPAPAGLVSWYRAEGDAADARGLNPGSFVGNVAFAPGMVGQAFALDGSGFISVPDSPSLPLTGEFTVEFWFDYTDVSDFRSLIAKRDFSGDLPTNFGVNVNATFLGFGLYYNDPTVTGGDDFNAVGSPFEAARLMPVPSANQ